MDIKRLIFRKFRSYMIKNMLSILLLLVTVIPVCSIYYSEQTETIINNQKISLSAFTETIDQQIGMYLTMLESDFMQNDMRIFAQKSKLESGDYKEINRIKSTISSICTSNDLIMDTFVFFDNSNTIISNYGCFTSLANNTGTDYFLRYYTFGNDEFINMLQQTASKRTSLSYISNMIVSCKGWPTEKGVAFAIERCLSYNIRVYLLIDQSSLENLFSSVNGQIVLWDMNKTVLTTLFTETVPLFSVNDRFSVFSADHTYIQSALQIDKNKYTDVLDSAFVTIGVFILLTVIGCLVFSFISAYSSCKPLYQILAKLKEINPDYSNQNEAFNYLLASMDHIQNKNIQMANQLNAIENEVNVSTIDRYLYAPAKADSELLKPIDNFPLHYLLGYAIIRIADNIPNEQDISFLEATIGNQLANEINAIHHVIDSNSFILIIPSADDEITQIDILRGKVDSICKTFNISICVAISRQHYSINQLNIAYEESRSVMFAYSGIPGVHVYQTQDEAIAVPRFDTRMLYDAVLQNDYPLAHDILSDLMSNKYDFISFEQRFRYARTLILLAANTFMSSSDIPHISYSSASSPDHLFEMLCSFTQQICDASEARNRVDSDPDSVSKALCKQVIEYINEHYVDDSLSIQRICEDCHITEKKLNEVCRTTTGMNTSAFIHQLRMDKAASLLRNSDIKVIDIINSCGYNTANAFYKAFKLCFGKSPSEYRDTYRKSNSTIR